MRDTGTPTAPFRTRRSTITDVATTAGVAVGTVSRYLNGHVVRRSNRDQIERAIETLSYRRNAAATTMKTDLTNMVGLLVPAYDEFHAALLGHLVKLIHATGRVVLTYCHDTDPQTIADALGFFSTHRVDALIMVGFTEFYDQVEELVGHGVPVIFYNNDIRGLNVDRVFVANKNASYRAVCHLLDLGHERTAVIAGKLKESSGRERLDGYYQALMERGIAVNSDFVTYGHWRQEGGYAAIRQLMALPTPPTAVFICNSPMAVGALEWLKEQRLRLPDDLSLVSFDDVEVFRLYESGVTAVAQPVARIADCITALLVSRLSNPDEASTRSVTLDCDIILRGSTRRHVPAT